MVLGLRPPDPTSEPAPLRVSLVCQHSGDTQRPNTHATRGTPATHARKSDTRSRVRPTAGRGIQWQASTRKGRSIGVDKTTVRRVRPQDAARVRALRLEMLADTPLAYLERIDEAAAKPHAEFQ